MSLYEGIAEDTQELAKVTKSFFDQIRNKWVNFDNKAIYIVWGPPVNKLKTKWGIREKKIAAVDFDDKHYIVYIGEYNRESALERPYVAIRKNEVGAKLKGESAFYHDLYAGVNTINKLGITENKDKSNKPNMKSKQRQTIKEMSAKTLKEQMKTNKVLFEQSVGNFRKQLKEMRGFGLGQGFKQPSTMQENEEEGYGEVIYFQDHQAEETAQIFDEHGVEAAINHLKQWDDDEYNDIRSYEDVGRGTDTYEGKGDNEGYILSINTGLPFVALYMDMSKVNKFPQNEMEGDYASKGLMLGDGFRLGEGKLPKNMNLTETKLVKLIENIVTNLKGNSDYTNLRFVDKITRKYNLTEGVAKNCKKIIRSKNSKKTGLKLYKYLAENVMPATREKYAKYSGMKAPSAKMVKAIKENFNRFQKKFTTLEAISKTASKLNVPVAMIQEMYNLQKKAYKLKMEGKKLAKGVVGKLLGETYGRYQKMGEGDLYEAYDEMAEMMDYPMHEEMYEIDMNEAGFGGEPFGGGDYDPREEDFQDWEKEEEKLGLSPSVTDYDGMDYEDEMIPPVGPEMGLGDEMEEGLYEGSPLMMSEYDTPNEAKAAIQNELFPLLEKGKKERLFYATGEKEDMSVYLRDDYKKMYWLGNKLLAILADDPQSGMNASAPVFDAVTKVYYMVKNHEWKSGEIAGKLRELGETEKAEFYTQLAEIFSKILAYLDKLQEFAYANDYTNESEVPELDMDTMEGGDTGFDQMYNEMEGYLNEEDDDFGMGMGDEVDNFGAETEDNQVYVDGDMWTVDDKGEYYEVTEDYGNEYKVVVDAGQIQGPSADMLPSEVRQKILDMNQGMEPQL